MKSKITLLSLIALLAFARHATSQEPMPALPLAEGLTSGVPNPPVIDPTTGAVLDPAAAKLLNAAQEAWERRIPEVYFASAQLDEVVEFLTENFPEINFVPPGQNPHWEVNLQLRSVSLNEILKALEISSEGTIRGQRDPVSPRIVSFRVAASKPGPQESKPVLRAYSLARYLPANPVTSYYDTTSPTGKERAKKTEERAEVAIIGLHQTLDSAFELMEASALDKDRFERPKIEIHRETRLLIAVGTPEALEIIDQVINALIGNRENTNSDLLDVDIEQ